MGGKKKRERKKERNVLKKIIHLKIRRCKDSYNLMTVGFNLGTSEKSRKALKSDQQRYGILQRNLQIKDKF